MNLTETIKENQPHLFKQSTYSARPPLKTLQVSTLQNTSSHKTPKSARDPQKVLEYSNQILENVLSQETKLLPPSDYISRQPELNQKTRAVLVDWMVSVHRKFRLLPETLFMSVALVDRYLAVKAVTRKQVQLVGVTTLFLAAKYEEIYPPELKEFVYLTDRAFSKEQVITMERDILSALNFEVTMTSQWWYYAKFSEQLGLNKQSKCLGQYLLELALVEYWMVKYPPVLQAAAAVYLGTKLFKKDYSGLPSDIPVDSQEMKSCAKQMLILMQYASKHPLSAVREKFAKPQYDEVSMIRIS